MVALAPPMWSMLPPPPARTLSTPHSGFLRLRLPGKRGEAAFSGEDRGQLPCISCKTLLVEGGTGQGLPSPQCLAQSWACTPILLITHNSRPQPSAHPQNEGCLGTRVCLAGGLCRLLTLGSSPGATGGPGGPGSLGPSAPPVWGFVFQPFQQGPSPGSDTRLAQTHDTLKCNGTLTSQLLLKTVPSVGRMGRKFFKHLVGARHYARSFIDIISQ